MTDFEPTFLRTAINEVLPDLPEVTKDILEETLQSIGVETNDDFQFIEESDLHSALRPVQAQKAIAAWKLRCKSSIVVNDTNSTRSCLHKLNPFCCVCVCLFAGLQEK